MSEIRNGSDEGLIVLLDVREGWKNFCSVQVGKTLEFPVVGSSRDSSMPVLMMRVLAIVANDLLDSVVQEKRHRPSLLVFGECNGGGRDGMDVLLGLCDPAACSFCPHVGSHDSRQFAGCWACLTHVDLGSLTQEHVQRYLLGVSNLLWCVRSGNSR